MPKIPYEKIAPEVDKIFQKMVLSTDLKTVNHWWGVYLSLLEAAGWDLHSFQKEEERRVDEGWEEKKPTIALN